MLLSMGGGFHDRTIQLPKGSLFGDCNPTTDLPRLLGLYRNGDLKLDEPIAQPIDGAERLARRSPVASRR